ncbi:MAG: hypothetical protein ACPG6L_03295 [Nereida ignava]
MFGTMESWLFNLLHGYTGRKAGALPGYDPIKNAVLDCDELYGIITRYLVDEYPSERHYGVNMFGQRPINALQHTTHHYGATRPITGHERRIHAGFRVSAKITDEGVKAFRLPFNSPELQVIGDNHNSKVSVFVDPDWINEATVLVEGYEDPILVNLTWTALNDLTLAEYLKIAETMRAEDPAITAECEARLARVRRAREDHMHFLALEHKLPRSYMTIAECQKKADIVMAGQHASKHLSIKGTTPAGLVSAEDALPESSSIGAGFQPALEGQVENDTNTAVLEMELFKAPDIKGKLT